MTRVQEGCLLLLVLVLVLPVTPRPDAAASVKDVDSGTVKPLPEAKATTEQVTKPTTESKKKATLDLDKPKPTKPKDKPQDEETTTESMAKKPASVGIPLLARGEPVVVSADVPEATTPDSAARARALNVTANEPGNTLHSNVTDLSDVSMDDEDKEVEGGEYIAAHNGTSTTALGVRPLPTIAPGCREANRTYGIGDRIERGCEERCVCEPGGRIANCEPVCKSPLVRAGKKLADPFCHARSVPDDPCCAVLVCADSATEPEESCVFGNATVPRGQKVEDGCEKTCICEAGGHLKCQPRCPPNDTASGINQHDRCVVLQDPRDPTCCTITLCDVTLGDHEIKPENAGDLSVNLTDVKVLNSTAIKLKLSPESSDDAVIEISDNNHVWNQVKPSKDGIISGLLPAHSYYVRVVEGTRAGPATHVSLLAEVIKTGVPPEKSEKGSCSHRGKSYKIGAEWYDDCIAVCFCNETAQTECVTLECPTDFGLDVLDPHCLDWETVPPNHVAKAPNCCPQEVRCRNNGSCTYEGKAYDNWSRIPTDITGCEKECFCEFGNVTCSEVCPPVPAQPPSKLNCKGGDATLAHLPDDTCCLHWTCDKEETTTAQKEASATTPDYDQLPVGQYSGIPSRPSPPKFDIVVTDLRALDNQTVHLVFTVPQFLIGLNGRVEVRYTSDKSNPDPLTWKTQTFAPPTDLIDTDSLEFELSGLEPSTLYRLMIVVRILDVTNTHASKVYEVLTVTSVETNLRVAEVNATSAEVEWRFSEHELQFIDATYLMYKAKYDKTYQETPLLHRSIDHYLLEHLAPNTEYEVYLNAKDIVGQTGILVLKNNSQNFTTTSDMYSFDVKVEIKTAKSSEVEITWSGIPQPEEKYYNLIRAVYQTDSGKEGIVFFKKDKKETKKMISDLKPGTRYRLWLEVYQTNGQLKKSNVQDFVTKPGVLPPPGASQQQGKLASSIPLHEGDYYGALVIVGIVALMAILSTMILLMMVLKRRTSSKADISPRKTTSAYDNPSYKTCEEAVPNGRNRTSEHEMTTLNGHNNSHA